MLLYLSLLTLLTGLLAPTPQRERGNQGVNDELTLDSARPIIDNQRATVWDLSWTKGVPAGMERTSTNALWISVAPTPGTVVYWQKGAERRASQASGAPTHMVVVDIKDAPAGTLENKSGYSNAFPRPGSKKILENEHVVVWDYTWMLGQPTAMHFHDKDALVVYLKKGAVKSTTPDGKSDVTARTEGMTAFNARARVHTETLVEGESRAIITEFK
jgi:hypothetical protein